MKKEAEGVIVDGLWQKHYFKGRPYKLIWEAACPNINVTKYVFKHKKSLTLHQFPFFIEEKQIRIGVVSANAVGKNESMSRNVSANYKMILKMVNILSLYY